EETVVAPVEDVFLEEGGVQLVQVGLEDDVDVGRAAEGFQQAPDLGVLLPGGADLQPGAVENLEAAAAVAAGPPALRADVAQEDLHQGLGAVGPAVGGRGQGRLGQVAPPAGRV